MMSSLARICPKCGVSFERQQNRQTYCSKKCRTSANSKTSRERHREKLNAQTRAWREANPEKSKQSNRAWYEKNREKSLAARKARHERFREEENAKFRQRHAEHREDENASRREWHANHRDESNLKRKQHWSENRDQLCANKRKKYRSNREAFFGESLLRSAQYRAKKKGLLFDLTKEWLSARWTGKCELSGIPFALKDGAPGPKFYSPSIDRIVAHLGYVQTNCRIVLWAVNSLKHDATDADMYRVAKALAENSSYLSDR